MRRGGRPKGSFDENDDGDENVDYHEDSNESTQEEVAEAQIVLHLNLLINQLHWLSLSKLKGDVADRQELVQLWLLTKKQLQFHLYLPESHQELQKNKL